jgi:predicted DNA-binding ribbon-helix-helix protein
VKRESEKARGKAIKRRKSNPEVRRSRIVRRSIALGGPKTSVTLEEEFWIGLREILGQRVLRCQPSLERSTSTAWERDHSNLSSALRVLVLDFYRSQLPAGTEVGALLERSPSGPPRG